MGQYFWEFRSESALWENPHLPLEMTKLIMSIPFANLMAAYMYSLNMRQATP